MGEPEGSSSSLLTVRSHSARSPLKASSICEHSGRLWLCSVHAGQGYLLEHSEPVAADNPISASSTAVCFTLAKTEPSGKSP